MATVPEQISRDRSIPFSVHVLLEALYQKLSWARRDAPFVQISNAELTARTHMPAHILSRTFRAASDLGLVWMDTRPVVDQVDGRDVGRGVSRGWGLLPYDDATIKARQAEAAEALQGSCDS